MEINVKMLTEEAYRTLRKDAKGVYDMILQHPSDATWLKDYLGFDPYEEKKYTIDDFNLDIDDDYKNVELANAITLYERLNKLPKYILCNTRFWLWITFEKAYKQSQATIPLTGHSIVENWWLCGNSRRDLMLGVISREYFRVDVSIDDSLPNKYQLTEFLLEHERVYRNLSFRNIGMIKNVSLGLIKAEYDVEKEYGFKISSALAPEIMKDASRIGSVMLIDTLSKQEVYDTLKQKILAKFTN